MTEASDEKDLLRGTEAASEHADPRTEPDAAKLSDAAAAEAARAFLGTAEPDEDPISVEVAKTALRKAGAVAESVRRTAEISEEGRRAVDETVRGAQQAKTRMETIAERILALSEQAQAIAEITATVNELAEQSNVVLLVGRVGASIATRPDARPALQGVDLEAGIIGEGRQAGRSSGKPGLDPGIRLEREAVLDRLSFDAEIVKGDEVDAVDIEQLPELAKLMGRARGDDDARSCERGGHSATGAVQGPQRRTVERAAACASNSFSRPVWARSRRLSTRARSKGLPSAVPCSSTYLPASVAMTLKSTSAFESSG